MRFSTWVTMVFFCSALLWLGSMAVSAQETTEVSSSPTPEVNSTITAATVLQEAQRVMEQADRQSASTFNMMNWLFGFIQVVGVLIAVVAVFASYITSQRRHIKEAQEFIEEARVTIAQEVATTQDLIKQLNEALQNVGELTSLRDQIHTGLKEVSEKTSKVAEALSLTQFAQRQIAIGNLVAATDNLNKACEVDPENRIIHYFLGDVYVRLGQLNEGIKHLRQARSGEYKIPSAEASYAYAIRLQGDHNPQKAESHYAEAIIIFDEVFQTSPDLLDISGESVFGALAGLYRRQGRIEKAIEWYEHARKITPQNSYPLNNLAVLNFRLGKSEVKAYFEDCLKIAQDRLNVRSFDYWNRFDLLTAQIALDTPFEKLEAQLQAVFKLVSNPGPLEKFLLGLEDLQKAPAPPVSIDQVINEVRREINQKK
jgi:tetratricopeptide (TPR) repeat protein